MDLTPNDIRNYEFPTQMRGYDREDVDAFMEQVARAMDQLKQENLKLTMQIESLNTQLTGLKQFEETIKNAAIDARRNADMTISSAKKEAEMIISAARKDADKIMGSRAERANELEVQLTKLELARKSYHTKLKNLIESHIEIVDEIVNAEAPDDVKKAIAERQAQQAKADQQAQQEQQPTPQQPTAQAQPQPQAQTPAATAPQTEQPQVQSQPQPAEDGLPDLMGDEEKVEVTDSSEFESAMRETVGTPAPQETRRTEESNEASNIIPAEVAKKLSDEVDPELLAALDGYARVAKTENNQNERPGNVVAHRDPGEDDDDNGSTGKVEAQDEPEEGYDHNTIDPDVPVGNDEPAAKAESSDNNELADALDKVAQKFEEEMDKAAQNR